MGMNDHMAGMAFASGNAEGEAIKPTSAIANAEDTLRAARNLAIRVEHVIDRLCGAVLSGSKTVGACDVEPADAVPPVLRRLRSASEGTAFAIGRAMSALDRLDVELD